MADQRITELTSLPKGSVAATDVLPIADISASETKKVTAKDLVDAGLDLINTGSIDLNKLDQNSTTKLGTTALADDAVTAAKLANDSSVVVQTTPPTLDNFSGKGLFNPSTGNVQIYASGAYQQVVMPTAGIGNLQVTTEKLATGAVTTAKVTPLGSAAYADLSVITSKLDDGAVTTAKIATGAVTTASLGVNSVTTAALADNAVDTAAIQNAAVTEAKIGLGAVTTGKLADLGITNVKIANTTIEYGKLNLSDGSLPGAKIATDSITATQIAAGAIQSSELASSAVTTAKIADGAVTATKLAADSITASNIAPSAVGASELADNSVDTAAVIDLAITEAKLADGAVATAKLGSLAVINEKIANTTIAYEKLNLADGSVPGAKIATGSVTSTQIGASAVTTTALNNLAVTTGKLADLAVSNAKLDANAVDSTKIAAGGIATTNIASSAVTYAKIQNVSGTDKLLGRSTAGSGIVEEINCTAAGRALLDDASATDQRNTLGLGTLSTASGTWLNGSSFSGTSSGTNTGDQTITLTGDVTGSGTGSFAATIAGSAVTEAKLATNAVTTAKVLDDAITAEKLANNSAAIVSAATPTGTGSFTGQQWFDSNTEIEYTWDGVAWVRQAGIGTLTFTDSTPITFSVAYPDPYSATITTTLDTQSANAVFVGPSSGANASPTFRALVPADLPNATASAKGIIQPGTGLTVTDGVLNHTASITGATVSGFTFNASGHITAATALVASDIPDLDTSKVTTGTFATARIADDAVTGAKLADKSTAQIGEALPTADYIGQIFFNPIDKAFFLWDGNVWQPIGISFGQITFAGTFDASSATGGTTGKVASVTTAGDAILDAGSALPAASATNANYYLVVSVAGTPTSGQVSGTELSPPDYIISDGVGWRKVDVSNTVASLTAANVTFSAAGAISAGNVQTAIEEVSSECRNATNITSGTLIATVGGTGITTYAKGDLIAGTGTNTLGKLAISATAGQVLRVAAASPGTTTGLEWATPNAGTVTTVGSTNAAVTFTNATTTPSFTIRAATTGLDGLVQLSDSTSTDSSSLAATAKAVKAAYDLAALALPKDNGTITTRVNITSGANIVFKGAAGDITLAPATSTAARSITLPDNTGTVVTTGSSAVVTGTMIAGTTISNSNIATDAGIVDTKLATISTSGKVANTATTATSANTNSAIVARDGSGNFSAGTITASLTGLASLNLPLAGGTLTGALTLSADPAAALHAVPRQWTDANPAKLSCRVASTTALTVTATSSTLTNAGTQAAISIDGQALSLGNRVLIKDQASSAQNGIYTVTTLGTISTNWVLTRAVDADSWAELNGATVAVVQGTANAGTTWLCTAAFTGTLGTTAITFRSLSNAQTSAVSDLSTSGLITRTGADTVAARSIAVSDTGRLTVTNGDGISGNPTLDLVTSGVSAGTYNNSSTAVRPFTVDTYGRVTAIGTAVTIAPAFSSITGTPTTLSGYGITDAQAKDADLTAIAGLTGTSGFLKKTAADTWSLDTSTYLTGNQSISVSGDATGTGSTSIALTLANSGVTAGTYNNDGTQVRPFTVDAKGRVTSIGSAVSISIPYSQVSDSPYKDGVVVATTAALTVSISGNVLTNTGTLAALSIDGVALALNNRVLVKDQAAAAQNGIYYVSAVGSASVAWTLTRTTDADSSSELAGAIVTVDRGTTNAAKIFTNNYPSTGTLNTTVVDWREVVSADSGTYAISVSGNSATATKLATARAINGVNFDGLAAITVTANTTNALTLSNAGTGAASGTTFNGGTAQTISYNSVGAPSTTGTNASGTWGIAISGNANTATTLATARGINGVNFDGSTAITVTANTSTALTFNNVGSGAISGTTFNGGTAQTISYNTIGAPSTTGTNASGTWGISVSGSAATLTTMRTLWGQNFNGSQSVSGNLTSVGNITGTSSITITSGGTNQAISFNTSKGTAFSFDGDNFLRYGNIYISPYQDAQATSLATTRASDYLYWRGKYWNGTASVLRDWSAYYVPDTNGNGFWKLRSPDADRLYVGATSAGVGAAASYTWDIQNTTGTANCRILGSNGGGSVLEIGQGSTSNQYAYIDLIGDTTYSDYGLRIERGDTGANATSRIVHRGTGDFILKANDAATLKLYTADVERIAINSLGRISLNGQRALYGARGTGNTVAYAGTAGGTALTTWDSVNYTAIQFVREVSSVDTQVGAITCTDTATTYATSSDYRLKENLIPLSNASERLLQIPVYRFNFIANEDKTVDGFLAHEVQEFVPEAVTGEKDEVDDDENPVYQGIDQSKLVPLLTAALQEALARISEIESTLESLAPS